MIVGDWNPFKRPDGVMMAPYRGHEWRPTLPLSEGHFSCAECGAKINHISEMGSYHGQCNPRYAPISWLSKQERDVVMQSALHKLP